MQVSQQNEALNGPFWVRLCETVSTKGELVEVDVIRKKDKLLQKIGNTNKDWYSSLYYYGSDAKTHWDTHQSMKGYKGSAYTNRLLFDFDSKLDPEQAKDDACTLLERLANEGVDVANSCRVFFSGNKGFHVEVLVDRHFKPEELKPICANLAVDLKTFDTSVYNTTRLIRLVNTKHQESGLYKIEISPDDILNLSVEQIRDKAKTPVEYPEYELTPVKNLDFLKKYEGSFSPLAKPVEVDVEDVDGIRGLDQIDFSKMPKGMPRCLYALSHGVMAPGERNHLFFRLAAYYRNQGMTKEVCYNTLKGVARENFRLYPESGPVTKEEIWNTVINSVYSDTWKQVPGATGTDAENSLLKKYCLACDRFTEKKCSLHTSSTKRDEPVQISDVFDNFRNFAENFDRNSVRTGIEFIDKNMNISVGTTTLIVGASGCHRKGEKVLMYDGTIKKVEDIEINDKLMGPDSKPRTVLQLCRGIDAMYKVTPVKGSAFYVNGNHVLSHLNSHNNWQHLTINELLARRQTSKNTGRKLVRTGVDFPEKELKVDPYMLGIWLGDGHSSGSTFTFLDRELIDYVKQYCHSQGLQFAEQPVKNTITNYSVSSKTAKFLNNLRFYGLVNNKHIPHDFKTASRHQRLELLAGLLDTDGHLNTNCFDIIQKRKTLAEDIVFLSRSLGFAAYLTPCTKSSQTGKSGLYYKVSISGDVSEIPTKLHRKKATKRQHTKDVLKTGFQVHKVAEQEEYFGFHVDGDNLYLLEDFTITHNSGKTTLGLNIMERANALGQHTVFFSLDMHQNLVYLKLAQKLTNYSQKQILHIFQTRQKDKMDEIRAVIAEKYGMTFFDFNSTLTLQQMRDKVLDIQDKNGVDVKLVLVDYASRITGEFKDSYSQARANALGSTGVAVDTNAAWLYISQVSRQVGDSCTPLRTKRAAKESGDWEESATNVVTVWRPFEGDPVRDDVMRLYLAKNRMGQQLEQVLHWDGSKGIIRDMDEDELALYEETRGQKEEKEYLKSKYAAKTGG